MVKLLDRVLGQTHLLRAPMLQSAFFLICENAACTVVFAVTTHRWFVLCSAASMASAVCQSRHQKLAKEGYWPQSHWAVREQLRQYIFLRRYKRPDPEVTPIMMAALKSESTCIQAT